VLETDKILAGRVVDVPINMSSSKQKKVHYERGTKGKGHRSRDSGVGSSSASDRASLGTSGGAEDSPFDEDQRHILSAVQEALDAANERIRHLEAANSSLNAELSDSNKENRIIKREKSELLHKIDRLKKDLADEQDLSDRLRRESSARSAAAPGKRLVDPSST
jgi:chromosome segregation ATPase